MTTLHPDFAGLTVQPGESHITARHELFDIVNLISFGGAADRPTHVPERLGATRGIALWESTGAADQLPFWNTVYDGDTYLYIVSGSVRIEFKETDGTERYGHYLARTGDLFKLPNAVAHRTFSGDGKRRITLEVMPDNPHWDLIGRTEVEPDLSQRIGGFSFGVGPDTVRVVTPGGTIECPRDFFGKALRALSKYELHLGHNELDGGLIVHDEGTTVRLSVPGYTETLDGLAVLAVLRGLLLQLQA